MIFVEIPDLADARATSARNGGGWFIADSFSFGVEREMKESGEKPSVTLSLPLTQATAALLQRAVEGRSIGDVVIELESEARFGHLGQADRLPPYKLYRCFVKSWSTSGDADDRPTVHVVIEFEQIEVE